MARCARRGSKSPRPGGSRGDRERRTRSEECPPQILRGLRDPERCDAWLHRLLVRACYRAAKRRRTREIVEIALDRGDACRDRLLRQALHLAIPAAWWASTARARPVATDVFDRVRDWMAVSGMRPRWPNRAISLRSFDAYQDLRVTSRPSVVIDAAAMKLRGRRPHPSHGVAGRTDDDLSVTPMEDVDRERIERRLATLFERRPKEVLRPGTSVAPRARERQAHAPRQQHGAACAVAGRPAGPQASRHRLAHPRGGG